MDAGVTPSDANGQENQQSPEQVRGAIPAITSTVSGLPISPAYAGAGIVSSFFRVSRRASFARAAVTARPTVPYEKNYVPQRRGQSSIVYREREMIGDGVAHVDPMDAFREQSFKETDKRDNKVEKPVEKDYKSAGRTAYKSENKENQERSAKRQVRYTQA